MLPDVTWSVVFVSRDGYPSEEIYTYGDRKEAEHHFSLFISADNGELYRKVSLVETDWLTRETRLLKVCDFNALNAAGTV